MVLQRMFLYGDYRIVDRDGALEFGTRLAEYNYGGVMRHCARLLSRPWPNRMIEIEYSA